MTKILTRLEMGQGADAGLPTLVSAALDFRCRSGGRALFVATCQRVRRLVSRIT